MAAAYPTDYPFNVNNEGWPEYVYASPYPHAYYHDNGSIPMEPYLVVPQNLSETNNDPFHDQSHLNYALPLPIRRHTPGSTDPKLQNLTRHTPSSPPLLPRARTPSPPPLLPRARTPSPPAPPPARERSPSPPPPPARARVTFKRESSKLNYQPPPIVQNNSPVPTDPDERPIKPMKDTSVYHNQSSSKKLLNQEKSISQPKPPSQPKPVQISPRYEFDTKLPPPPSRTPMSNASSRRPVRTDLVPSIPFGIPSHPIRSRRIIVEEYEDYPVTYARPVPKQVIQYQESPGMTTREQENYEMSRIRRVVRVRSPPIRTVVYRT